MPVAPSFTSFVCRCMFESITALLFLFSIFFVKEGSRCYSSLFYNLPQTWNSIIYWGRLSDFLTLLWDRKLSIFQGMPGHDSSFTVFFMKSSVAMVSYKRGYSQICVLWLMFKKYVTTVNGHQQTEWIISHQHHNIWMPL